MLNSFLLRANFGHHLRQVFILFYSSHLLPVHHDLVLSIERICLRRGELYMLLHDMPMQLSLLPRLNKHLLHASIVNYPVRSAYLRGALAYLQLWAASHCIIGCGLPRRPSNHRRARLSLFGS